MAIKAINTQGGDGTAIPTGYMAETVTLGNTSQAGGAGAWAANTTPMATLQPGSWIILGNAVGALTTVAQAVAISTSTTAGSGIITQCNMTTNSSINAQMQMQVIVYRVPPGSTQPLYMHCYNASGTATGSVSGIAIRIA